MATSTTAGFRLSAPGVSLDISRSYSLESNPVLIEVSLTSSQANKAVNCAIDISQLKVLGILCANSLTVKTNSSGSPDDTLTQAAGKGIQWDSDSGHENPLTADVTVLYLTNNTASATTAYIFVAQDPTP